MADVPPLSVFEPALTVEFDLFKPEIFVERHTWRIRQRNYGVGGVEALFAQLCESLR